MEKNKKAQVGSSFVFGLIGLVALIFICVALIGIERSGTDVKVMTLLLDNASVNARTHFIVNESNGVIINVVYSWVNFILYSTLEVSKAAIVYAGANPDVVNPHSLLWIILISLFVPIIWYGGLCIAAIFLIIREWYLNKKEKKLLRKD